MSKNLKIFLSILALISIIISLVIIFNWRLDDLDKLIKNPLNIKRKTEKSISKPNLEPTPTLKENINSSFSGFVSYVPVKLLEVPSLKLEPPVENKYFDTLLAPLLRGNDKSVFLAFFLGKGAEIKSVFKGHVVDIQNIKKGSASFPEEPNFSQILFENEDGSLMAEYTFIGDVFVKKDDFLEAGNVLAKSNEGSLFFREGSNFSIILSKQIEQDKYQMIGLTKEIFLK